MTDVAPIALLEALDEWDSLNAGDQVLVRFGSAGAQAAIITGRTRGGHLMGRKYRAKSRSYTSPVRIHPTDLIRVIKRKEEN